MNPVFEFLNGKTYKLDGVSGKFEHKAYTDRLGLLRQELYHNPDKRGQRTRYYEEKRRLLGDDWSTCLTQNIDGYCDIAIELGYKEA
jgi:hypothetical protein